MFLWPDSPDKLFKMLFIAVAILFFSDTGLYLVKHRSSKGHIVLSVVTYMIIIALFVQLYVVYRG